MAGMKKSVWLCGISALLVAGALSVPAASAQALQASFTPPQAQLLLTRTLHRPLPDGKAIVTRRSYAVRIVRDGAGYRVDGTLVEARVEAPPALAALADIERRRPDNGNFPIMLDAKGLIVGGVGLQSDGSLDRAAVVAAEAVGGSGLPAIDMLQVQAFIKQLPSRAPRSAWPADVFHPAPGKRSEARTIPLTGGAVGQVTIEIEAQGPAQDGQIAMLSRVVTTDLAGDKRVTSEQWQLVRGLHEPGR
jgi:hypothetical protein